jgi:hypothetical protein
MVKGSWVDETEGEAVRWGGKVKERGLNREVKPEDWEKVMRKVRSLANQGQEKTEKQQRGGWPELAGVKAWRDWLTD